MPNMTLETQSLVQRCLANCNLNTCGAQAVSSKQIELFETCVSPLHSAAREHNLHALYHVQRVLVLP